MKSRIIKRALSGTSAVALALMSVDIGPTLVFADETLSLSGDADSGYYVNMPASGTDTLTLSDDTIESFKVYDNGGKDGNYSNNCNGYLVLTAPEGYNLVLSGNIVTQENYDELSVYNSDYVDGNKLIDGLSGSQTDIEQVISSGRSLMLNFRSNYYGNYDGLDLTVDVVKYDTTVTFMYGDKAIVRNIYEGGNIYPPTAREILGDEFDESTCYAFSFTDGEGAEFNENTTVNEDMNVTVTLEEAIPMKGSGTVSDPYEIDNAKQLCRFRDMVNNGHTDLCAKLTNDIDLSDMCGESIGSWEPIGNDIVRFSGTFDGDGHSITGLYIYSDKQYLGLFGYVYRGTLKNLDVTGNVTYDGRGHYTTIIAGQAMSSKFINCISRGNVSGYAYCAGMAGDGEGSTFSGCINYADIHARNSIAGGIFGGYVREVSDCLNLGNISSDYESYGSATIGSSYKDDSAAIKNSLNLTAPGSHVTENAPYYIYGETASEGLTEDMLTSGALAYQLQGDREEIFWGQTLTGENADAHPIPTKDETKRVFYNSDTGEYYNLTYHNISCSSSDNGTVSVDNATVAVGETVTLTVTPDTGCVVKSVKVGDDEITPVDGVYSFIMPDEDVTVTAEFLLDLTVTPAEDLVYTGEAQKLVDESSVADGAVVNYALKQEPEIVTNNDGEIYVDSLKKGTVYKAETMSRIYFPDDYEMIFGDKTYTVSDGFGSVRFFYSESNGYRVEYYSFIHDCPVNATLELGENNNGVIVTDVDTENKTFTVEPVNTNDLSNVDSSIWLNWSETIPEVTDAGDYTVYYKGDGVNYSDEIKSFDVTIAKADLTVTATGYEGTFDGNAHSISVDVGDSDAIVYYARSALNADNYAKSGSTENLSFTNAGIYRVYYYVTTGNYDPQPVSGSKMVVIAKADAPELTEDQKPTPVEDLIYTGEDQDLVVAPTSIPDGYSIRYSINGGAWISTLPTAIESGTYTVAYKYVENTNFKDIAGETFTITVKDKYTEPMWVWADDYSSATATFIKNDNSSEPIILDAEVTSEVVAEPTYTEYGKTVYFATVELEGKTYTYRKPVITAKLALTHIEAVPATCDEAGNIEYWFDAENEKYFADDKGENEITMADTIVAPIDHAYGEPQWIWNAENAATATFKCANCGDEQVVNAVVTAEVTAPTYTKNGKTVYTATVNFDGKTYTDTLTVTIGKKAYTAPTISYLKGDGAVKLSWNAIEGAERYAIAGFIDGKWKLLNRTEDTSFIIENLEAGKEYKVAVVAMFDGEYIMDFSNAITVTPKPAAASVYPKITEIEYNEQYHQFKLNWTEVPNAQNYGIAVYLAGKWKIQTQSIPAGTTSYTSPKLKAGSTYKMIVCAKVNGKWDLSALSSRAFEVTVK